VVNRKYRWHINTGNLEGESIDKTEHASFGEEAFRQVKLRETANGRYNEELDSPFSPEYAISGIRSSKRTSRPTPLIMGMLLASLLGEENLADGESMSESNPGVRKMMVAEIENGGDPEDFGFGGGAEGSIERKVGCQVLWYSHL
jgi:hypothetical protein